MATDQDAQDEVLNESVVRLTARTLIVLAGGLVLAFVAAGPNDPGNPMIYRVRVGIGVGVVVASILTLWLLTRGRTKSAGLLLICALCSLFMFGTFASGLGVLSLSLPLLSFIILFASFVLSPRAGMVFTAIAIATTLALLWAQHLGFIREPSAGNLPPPPFAAAVYIMLFALVGWLSARYSNLFRKAAADETNSRQKLAESEMHLRTIIDNEPECVKLVAANGALLEMNRAGLDLIEADTAGQVLGRVIFPELVLSEHQAPFKALADRVMQGESGTLEFEIRGYKGGHRWLRTHAVPMRHPGGEIYGLLGLTRDITERKRAERELEQEKQRLKDFSDSSADWFWETDADLRFSFFSSNFEDAYGLKPEALLGRTRLEILATDELNSSEVLTAHIAQIQLHQPFRDFEYRIRDAAGSVRWISVSGIPITGAEGDFAGYRGTGRIITKRKALEAELERHRHDLEQLVEARTNELERARDAAETANIAKSAFLANMSHEIRTPLNAITGFAGLVRRGGLTPSQSAWLDKHDASVDHLLEIIDAVLDLSKIEAGKFLLEHINVRVDAILANVVAMLQTRADVKGISLHMQAPPISHHLTGDPTRLQQALLNYVANAIKFTDVGSVVVNAIVVDETSDSALLRFEVTDTGIGIDHGVAQRLFAPFVQIDNSSTRKYGGTGLGLAITRKLAELMGGTAGVSSTLGQGSTFWFTARLGKSGTHVEPAELESYDASDEVELRRNHVGRRILLVEDDPVNCEVTSMQLEGAGLVVDIARNGKEAVQLAETTQFDLILMDVQMPVMNGLESTRRIRRLPAGDRIPILALTANAFAEDRAACLEAGMNDFVTKPVNPAVLFDRLVMWLTPRHRQA